jgi:hypothetical protein
MDAPTLLQTILIATLVGSSASLFHTIASILVACFCTVVCVDDRRRVAVFDHLLGHIGLCSRRRVGPNDPPADGLHFAFLSGPVFAVRATTPGGFRSEAEVGYVLYVVGGAARRKLESLISGDSSEIMTRWVYSPAPWRTSVTTVRQRAPPAAWPGQAPIIARICDAYAQGQRSSALIVGPPGRGKSRLAELVAVELRARYTVEPVVVKNFDPTARGQLLDDILACPTQGEPVIVVLDEYDAVIAHAEGKLDGDAEGSSLAKNRSSMLSCLDRLGVMAHVIVIATTNVSEENLETAYVRRGRLDLHFVLADAPPGE